MQLLQTPAPEGEFKEVRHVKRRRGHSVLNHEPQGLLLPQGRATILLYQELQVCGIESTLEVRVLSPYFHVRLVEKGSLTTPASFGTILRPNLQPMAFLVCPSLTTCLSVQP